jgi:Cdc6-like AAA superfamily ATPase
MGNQSGNGKIIRNLAMFEEDYMPPKIHFRDSQIRVLQLCLESCTKGNRPIHAFVCGPSGTGKTLIANAMLKELEEHSIMGTYVNCWEYQSFYSIIDKIIDDFHVLRAERVNSVYKMEKLERFLNDKPFVLILDNIDRLDPKDIDHILYNLSDLAKTGLVCIGYGMAFLQKLDDRVRSRLNPKLIECPAYSKRELMNILKERAESGLEDGTWDFRILRRVLNLANGDARMAIQALRNAACLAENARARRIEAKDLEKGFIDARELKINQILDRLNPHHRLIYEVICEKRKIMSGMLWVAYKEACKKKKIKAIPQRTFQYYRDELLYRGLICSKRLRIRGNVRLYSASLNPI